MKTNIYFRFRAVKIDFSGSADTENVIVHCTSQNKHNLVSQFYIRVDSFQ